MTQEQTLYRIVELTTTGWGVYKTALTREQCEAEYQFLVNEGYNPNSLKVERIK